MTTSQASRIYGIPYNSLLMYVRGKYGKSLKLDVLKQQTPAAKDNLNTIGNSRSTPKEKMAAEKQRINQNNQQQNRNSFSPYGSNRAENNRMNPFAPALFQNLSGLQEQLLGILPQDSSRMRELLQNVHREQQQNAENTDGFKHSPASGTGVTAAVSSGSGGGLLMTTGGGNSGIQGSSGGSDLSRSPMTSEHSDNEENKEEEEENEIEIEDEVKEEKKKDTKESEDKNNDDDNDNNNRDGPSPIAVNVPQSGEISAQ